MIDNNGDTLCDTCAANLTRIRVKTGRPAWPFCPHGAVGGDRGRSAYVADEIPGGITIENGVPHPVTVYSYTEMNQLFASQGVERKERFCPTPGTSHDPAGVQDPKKYVDPKTLENGAALILRAQQSAGKEAEDAEFVDRMFINQDIHVMSESEARDRHRQIEEQDRNRGRR